MKNIKRVKQEHSSSCGIACVAMVAGLPYKQVLKRAKERISWDRENSFYTTFLDLKVLLDSFGIAHSNGHAVRNWDTVSDLAIVAINYSEKMNKWHWVVFCRNGEFKYVLDPKSKNEKRTDFSRMRLRSYLPIIS